MYKMRVTKSGVSLRYQESPSEIWSLPPKLGGLASMHITNISTFTVLLCVLVGIFNSNVEQINDGLESLKLVIFNF